MIKNKSAEKRIRQNEKKRRQNASQKSSLRTAVKKVLKTISNPTNPQEMVDNFKEFTKRIDTAARKGIIHKRTAARKKSRLARKINAVTIKTS